MKVGNRLPDITASLPSAETVAFAKLGKPLVLFFYPKAFSPVCTAEACHFRDLEAEFAKSGAAVYGVAPDSPETLERFEKEHKMPFPSFSDPSKELARAFGASGPLGMKRLTLVADASGKVVQVYSNILNANAHASKALEALAALVSGI